MLTPDQQRVKQLLCETITLLCKNGLHFEAEFSIDALIGITLDQREVFLVSIKETVQLGEMYVRNKPASMASTIVAEQSCERNTAEDSTTKYCASMPRPVTTNTPSSAPVESSSSVATPEARSWHAPLADSCPPSSHSRSNVERVSVKLELKSRKRHLSSYDTPTPSVEKRQWQASTPPIRNRALREEIQEDTGPLSRVVTSIPESREENGISVTGAESRVDQSIDHRETAEEAMETRVETERLSSDDRRNDGSTQSHLWHMVADENGRHVDGDSERNTNKNNSCKSSDDDDDDDEEEEPVFIKQEPAYQTASIDASAYQQHKYRMALNNERIPAVPVQSYLPFNYFEAQRASRPPLNPSPLDGSSMQEYKHCLPDITRFAQVRKN